jgi:acetyltransferase
LVADWTNPESGEHQIIAVGRLTREHGAREAEIAVVVTDKFQNSGLGSELFARLIQVARDEKLTRITASILMENLAMRAIARRHGLWVKETDDMGMVQAALEL